MAPALDAPPATALTPTDIRDAYDLPDGGDGRTVAVVDAFGYSTAEADLAVFRQQYGLPPCTTENGCFTRVDQRGGTDYPPDDTRPLGWAVESALDLDAVSAACPNCHLLLVEADDDGIENMATAVDTAVDLGAKYVSNSYGLFEDAFELGLDAHYSRPGVVLTVSTGDTGAATSWPATNPDVVAVGGTTLTRDGSERGWQETAWGAQFDSDGGGSGCSPFEPKPDYQQPVDTGCDRRAIADVSADADPDSGLAVYATVGSDGWLQGGGTSLAAPLVAAMYALAGPPVPGTNPASYPYHDTADLNDVTEGVNGFCFPDVLCHAGPGWDGPTGLGTPHGVAAFSSGAVVGRVVDRDSREPIAGATVTVGGGVTTTTDADGRYVLAVPDGTYDVTAQTFDHRPKTRAGLQVSAGTAVTADFRLRAIPSRTLSGVVRDRSGHGWPLYARITVDGYPGGAVYTDPFTGRYSLDLPQQRTYTLHVTPLYPGYLTTDITVRLGRSDKQRNVGSSVDTSTCIAPGYAYRYRGSTEEFAGWPAHEPRDGWTIVDGNGNGEVWQFDNPRDLAPPPGGDEDFAIADATQYGTTGDLDTSLVSPVYDLSDATTPEVGLDTEFEPWLSGSFGDVDVSVDGGQTWTTAWHGSDFIYKGHLDVPIPQAAGEPDVRVRFHYVSTFEWWAVDNVFVGNRVCRPTDAGLVAGVVSDHNTGDPMVGVTVTGAGGTGVAAATPDDPGLPDGFYWLVTAHTGDQQFTASYRRYATGTAAVPVTDHAVVHSDWSMEAGLVTVSPADVGASTSLGGSRRREVTFTNEGTVPAHVKLSEENAGFTRMAGQRAQGSPLVRVRGHFSSASAVVDPARRPDAAAGAADGAWTPVADFPTPIMDNAVASDPATGRVYSVGGVDPTRMVARGYAYGPAQRQWSRIADLPQPVENAAAAFTGGRMYVIGGWDATGAVLSSVYAYDPAQDAWTRVADLPQPVTAAAATVLDGQVYVVGGCGTASCAPASAAAFRYDPDADAWTRLADYPRPVTFSACGGLGSAVYCAGGLQPSTDPFDNGVALTATYGYDPATGAWTRAADLPVDTWAASYGVANGRLVVAAGVVNDSSASTNEVHAYEPVADRWTDLPGAGVPEYRGGAACGFYKVGGSVDGGHTPAPFAEQLPGWGQCLGDVSWLAESGTELEIPAGESVTVAVTLDSSVLGQPGDYAGTLAVSTDTPYPVEPIGVALHVRPPHSWGKLAGTVTSARTGEPITGATVSVCTMYDPRTARCGTVTYTLRTDSDGHYQLWLDRGYSPLHVSAAKDGYATRFDVVRVRAGETTELDFALPSS